MKYFILILFFLSCFTSLHAEDPEKTRVDFGLKGGVNISGIAGDYAREINSFYKVSLHGGLFISYPIISEKLNFQMEFMFGGRGYKADVVDSIYDHSIVHNMYYWDIPLFFELNLGKGWEAHLGAQYSILLFEQYVNFVPERKSLLSVKNNDYGILLGGAYSIDSRNKIGIRYVYGLQDILNYDGKTSHSSLFQFYVAFTAF